MGRKGLKIVQGIGLTREVWDRIEAMRVPGEARIGVIESALLHEFELREGKAQHVPAKVGA